MADNMILTSNEARVLDYLKANPGWHSCKAIHQGTGLPMGSVHHACYGGSGRSTGLQNKGFPLLNEKRGHSTFFNLAIENDGGDKVTATAQKSKVYEEIQARESRLHALESEINVIQIELNALKTVA